MFKQAFIEHRIIMTPGPVEADSRVLKAMTSPIIGQFHPSFLKLMDEVMEMSKHVFSTQNKWADTINGTACAEIEALLMAVIEPNDKAYVPIFGRFGHLLSEISIRAQKDVSTTEKSLKSSILFQK